MRTLIFGMNMTLDGYIAAPGDDLGWSGGDGPDSSPIDKVDWNTRLITGDAVAEITRLKAEDPWSRRGPFPAA
ncbi:hypothetical protein [Nonomuraea sp. GTA35]|uniref:hypothetical protein n=1 Tax=Nonomuraea sp. GTA35 TaxID=1676746 RepID=UPI0035C09FCE